MAFTVVLLTLVACSIVDVGSCNTFCEGMTAIRCSVTINACEAPSYSYCMVCGEICHMCRHAGQDREKIVQALLGESQWETLAGFLGVGDGVLEGIWAHCGTRGSVSATCYRRQLVRHYCDKKAQACRQIASDMASILEHNMNNKRLANNLRQLFDIDIDDGHQPTDGSPPTDSTTRPPDDNSRPSSRPYDGQSLGVWPTDGSPPTDSTTPPPLHRDDKSQPSSWPYDGQSLGVWLTDNWVSLSLAATIVILSSVWLWCSKRKRESTAAEKLLNTANDVAKKVSSKKSSKEHSKKKTEKTAMDKKLGPNDLREIMEFLVDVNKNWKDLGLQLGLRGETLDGIEANYRDVKDCKREMISKWLKWVDIDYKPTWQHLADALRHRTVQHGPIAQAIEDEYSIILLD